MTVIDTENRLRALVMTDIMFTAEDKDYLRMTNAGRGDGLLWVILDNGGGDRMWVYIKGESAVIKGFDHESELNQFAADEWDSSFFESMFKDMPSELYDLFTEEERDETTFCLWTSNGGKVWTEHPREDDGGKGWLMGYLFESPKDLCEWAKDYYDRELPLDIAEMLMSGGVPSCGDILRAVPVRTAESVLSEFHKIWR